MFKMVFQLSLMFTNCLQIFEVRN